MVDSGANLTDSRSAEIIIVSCVSTGIAAATVALKIFARARIDASKIGWDDFFIFLSLVFCFDALWVEYAD